MSKATGGHHTKNGKDRTKDRADGDEQGDKLPPFRHITILGLGLIGSSLARAVRAHHRDMRVTAYDTNAEVRTIARRLNFCHVVAETLDDVLADTPDLVILAVPVGQMAVVAKTLVGKIPAEAVVSDVGSSKGDVAKILAQSLPNHIIVPAHPVAGTEDSGPEAGFTRLFVDRWCILTPIAQSTAEAVARLSDFWQSLGARVAKMDPTHHDLVLAVTSHVPHLIAYAIVGTASELEEVTEREVIKYSAGGFRDFTRIAASNPIMWRDVFLANREAVLSVLQRFNEDLTSLQQAIRRGDGPALESWFHRTRATRRSIIAEGQDDAAADFGRKH